MKIKTVKTTRDLREVAEHYLAEKPVKQKDNWRWIKDGVNYDDTGDEGDAAWGCVLRFDEEYDLGEFISIRPMTFEELEKEFKGETVWCLVEGQKDNKRCAYATRELIRVSWGNTPIQVSAETFCKEYTRGDGSRFKVEVY